MNKMIKVLVLLMAPLFLGASDFMDYTTLMNQKMETERRLEDHLQGIVSRIVGEGRSTVLVSVNLSDLSRSRETVEEWLERGEDAERRLPMREEYLPGIPRREDMAERETEVAERAGGKRLQDVITLPSEFIESMRISLILDSTISETVIATVENVITEVMDLDAARGDRLTIQTVDFAGRTVDFMGFLFNPYFYVISLVLIIITILALFLFGPLKKFLFATLQTMKDLKGMKSETEYSGGGGGGGGGFGITPDGEIEMEEEIEEDEELKEGEEADIEGEEEDEEFKKMTYIPLKFLENKDLKKLAYLLSFEKPEVGALLLKYLSPPRAAKVLSSIPGEERTIGITREIVKFQRTSKEVMQKIDEFLSRKIDYIAGGAESLVEMIEMMDEEKREQLLNQISSEDPEFAEKIKKRIFSFENIVNMDDPSIQTLIQEMETADLGAALKNVSEEVRNKFVSNMSEGAAALLKEEIEFGKKMTEEQIKQKQMEVVAKIKDLETSGSIAPVTGASKEELWVEELGEGEKEGVLEEIIKAAQEAYDKKQELEAAEAAGRQDDEAAFESYRKGLELYKHQDYDNAIKEFNKSIASNPSLWQSYQYIGSCYLALDNQDGAKKAYRKALELNPSNEQLRQWLESH